MILYFTGTGNSRYIAQELAHLLDDDITDTLQYLRAKESPELHSDNPWVFVCPIYGWRLPRVFSDWIERAVFSGSRKAYFVITCGSDIGDAKKYIRRLCRKKGFELCGVQDIVMPENYVAMFDVPDDTTSAKLRRHADRAVKKTAALIGGSQSLPSAKITLADKLKSSVVNPAFYAMCVKSKAFRLTGGCVSCGKCAESCPVNGIRMENGKPVWTGDCTHCMACICGCPASAIEYGKKSVGKPRYQCPPYIAEQKKESNGNMLKHSQDITLSVDDFDNLGNILPSRTLSLFQLLADNHAEKLGVGFEAMLSRNLLWVITQVKYQVFGEIRPGQRLIGETWPLPPTRVGFAREYLLSDEHGNVLIKGTSMWVQIDAEKRQLAQFTNVYPEGEYCTVHNFDGRTRRLRDFEAPGEALLIRPDETTIDRNGHVNNTKYADFAVAALNGLDGRISTVQIDYINEVMRDQPLHLYSTSGDGCVLVKGLSDESKRMFMCSVAYFGQEQ